MSTVTNLEAALREAIGQEEKAPEPEVVVDTSDWWAKAITPEETEDKKLFSGLFGWEPATGDFLVTTFKGLDNVPPVSFYNWPKESTEIFVAALEQGHKPRLVGPPGTGKTELARQVCAVTGRPYVRFNFNGAIEPDDFLGGVRLQGEETIFIPGEFPLAMGGPALVLLDEINRGPSSILMALQRMLERGGDLVLTQKLGQGDHIVKPHADFRMCSADNTLGLGDEMDKHSSACIQDVSMLNRWEVTIYMNYLTEAEETVMLKEWQPELPEVVAQKLASVSNLLHAAYKENEVELPFSPRNLMVVAEYTQLLHNPIAALQRNYVNSLPAEQRDVVAKLVHDTVGFPAEFGRLV